MTDEFEDARRAGALAAAPGPLDARDAIELSLALNQSEVALIDEVASLYARVAAAQRTVAQVSPIASEIARVMAVHRLVVEAARANVNHSTMFD